MSDLWLLLIPAVIAWGVYAKRNNKPLPRSKKILPKKLSHDYIKGLNFLLNEEPDKAVDLFIKMLEVDSDTVETHLALGNLFRRRGEVDRAIRIHQNLIARPKLETAYRLQSLLALAQDYLSAGVLDRSERLFLELIDLSQHVEISLKSLLTIYEQEKDWKKAIKSAKELANKCKLNMSLQIAQYYCELAEIAYKEKQYDIAIKLSKQALTNNNSCARANIILGRTYSSSKQYRQALNELLAIKKQSPDFYSEAVETIASIYIAQKKKTKLIQFLNDALHEFPKMPVALELANSLPELTGQSQYLQMLKQQVKQHPSIAGLNHLILLQLEDCHPDAKEDLDILHGLAQRLQAEYPDYQCTSCGFCAKHMHWQCPSCKQWDTVKPSFLTEDENENK